MCLVPAAAAAAAEKDHGYEDRQLNSRELRVAQKTRQPLLVIDSDSNE